MTAFRTAPDVALGLMTPQGREAAARNELEGSRLSEQALRTAGNWSASWPSGTQWIPQAAGAVQAGIIQTALDPLNVLFRPLEAARALRLAELPHTPLARAARAATQAAEERAAQAATGRTLPAARVPQAARRARIAVPGAGPPAPEGLPMPRPFLQHPEQGLARGARPVVDLGPQHPLTGRQVTVLSQNRQGVLVETQGRRLRLPPAALKSMEEFTAPSPPVQEPRPASPAPLTAPSFPRTIPEHPPEVQPPPEALQAQTEAPPPISAAPAAPKRVEDAGASVREMVEPEPEPAPASPTPNEASFTHGRSNARYYVHRSEFGTTVYIQRLENGNLKNVWKPSDALQRKAREALGMEPAPSPIQEPREVGGEGGGAPGGSAPAPSGPTAPEASRGVEPPSLTEPAPTPTTPPSATVFQDVLSDHPGRPPARSAQTLLDGLHQTWTAMDRHGSTMMTFREFWEAAPAAWRRAHPWKVFKERLGARVLEMARENPKTPKGLRWSLETPSGKAREANILHLELPDGSTRRYYGIDFRPETPVRQPTWQVPPRTTAAQVERQAKAAHFAGEPAGAQGELFPTARPQPAFEQPLLFARAPTGAPSGLPPPPAPAIPRTGWLSRVLRPYTPQRARQVMAGHDIVRGFVDRLDATLSHVPLRGSPRGVAGGFRPGLRAAWARAGDFGGAFHELFHRQDEVFGLRAALTADPAAHADLLALGARGRSSWQPGMPDSRRLAEGVAELGRLYIEDPGALNATPAGRDAFERWLVDTPDVGRHVVWAREEMQRNLAAAPRERVLANIVPQAAQTHMRRPSDVFRMLRSMVFDNLAYLDDINDAVRAAHGGELQPGDDVLAQAHLYRGTGAHVQHWLGERNPYTGRIEGGQVRWTPEGHREITGKRPLMAILQELDGMGRTAWRDFEGYLVTRREATHQARAIRTVNTPADVTAYNQWAEQRYPHFRRLAAEFHEWKDNVLQYGVDRGFVGPRQAAAVRRVEEAHVPFYRYFEPAANELPAELGGTGTPRGLTVGEPLARLRGGSQRQIESPLLHTLRFARLLLSGADRNAVGQTLARLVDEHTEGLGDVVREITHPVEMKKLGLDEVLSPRDLRQLMEQLMPGQDLEKDLGLTNDDLRGVIEAFPDRWLSRAEMRAPRNQNVIRVKQGDNWRVFQLTPRTYGAWTALRSEPPGLAVKLLGGLASFKREGIIKAPMFIGRHVPRRAGEYAIFSPHQHMVGQGLVRGIGQMLHAATGDPAAREMALSYRLMGGMNFSESGVRSAQEMLVRRMPEYDRRLTWLPSAPRMVGRRIADTMNDLWHAAQRINEWSEEPARLGEANLARQMGVRRGLHGAELEQFVAHQSRRLMDFALKGTGTEALKRIVPFFQPSLTGTWNLGAALARDPAGTLVKGFTLLTLPALALRAFNEGDPDYQDLDQQEKDLFLHIRVGPGARDFLRIPKPATVGVVFQTLVERAWQAFHGDPKAWDDLYARLAEGLAPMRISRSGIPYPDLGPAADLVAGMGFNWDAWRQRPIDPPWMDAEHVPLHLRADDYTTNTARWLANLPWIKGRWSPKQLDQAIYNLTGAVGVMVQRGLIDPLTSAPRPAGMYPEPRGVLFGQGKAGRAAENVLRSAPFAGAMAWGVRSESERRFSEELLHLQERARAAKAGEPFSPEEQARLQTMQATARQIRGLHAELQQERNQDRRDVLVRQIRDLANYGR